MATYSENFVVTALPAGYNGTKLRIAVLVSPRLSSDDPAKADLSNWPDAKDWPSIIPDWTVVINKGAKTHLFEHVPETSGSYDAAGWQQLFPSTMKVKPYKESDKSQAPIFSYPVKAVIDTAKDLHTAVLKDHRTDFPSLNALECMDAFQALKQAVDQDTADEVVCAQLSGPKPDSQHEAHHAFILAHAFGGVRPCSVSPLPVAHIESILPPTAQQDSVVDIKGTGFIASSVPMFDGLESPSFTVKSGTLINCKLPSGARVGVVPVVVRNADEFSNSVNFTVIKKPVVN